MFRKEIMFDDIVYQLLEDMLDDIVYPLLGN